MLKVKNTRSIIILALAVLLCVAIAIIVCVSITNKHKEDYNSALAELEAKAGEYSENSIILASTSAARAKSIAKRLGAELRISESGRFAALTLPEGVTVADVYADEENMKYISEMSLDYKVRTAGTTDDRYTARPEYSISDTEYSKQTYLDYLNLRNVWSSNKGSGITVAVIDTGIDTDHPEFEGRISLLSYNASTGVVLKDTLSSDGAYDTSIIEDTIGHGTMVSGVIAAGINGEGIVGIAPNANILVIKAEADENGIFQRSSDLVFGLYYAIECGADIVNMSLGNYSSENIYADALALAESKKVIVVASAGNDSTPSTHWPSSDERVIGVGALEDGGFGLASYSNYGDNTDVVAPGTVYTTAIGGGYDTANGTSFSTPIVAGAMALLKGQLTHRSIEYYRGILLSSVYDLGDKGEDFMFGYGLLDVSMLLSGSEVTITYDMMTDELDDIKETVVARMPIKRTPVPERLYSVFDGWYYDPYYTLEYQVGEDVVSDDITLYAKWCGEADGVPYTYEKLSDGTVAITSYTGRRRHITIPEYIEGRRVSAIAANAFAGNRDLASISLSSGITEIGDNAFDSCVSLRSIEIPASVVKIGKSAFSDCIRISEISFEATSQLVSIADFAFQSCSSLKEITLPASLKEINGSAFLGTLALSSIGVDYRNPYFTSNNGVLYNKTQSVIVAYPAGRTGVWSASDKTTTIGKYAFSRTLVSAVSLGRVEYIEESAFAYSSITKVELPKSLVSLGDSAFAYSAYLSSVTFNSDIKEIPYAAFGYTALKEISIPSSVTEIGDYAFFLVPLSSINFGADSSLRAIGAYAFSGAGISTLSIPSSVNTIGAYAFSGCLLLEDIDFGESSNLKAIGAYAFSSAILLTELKLPDSVKQIGAFAFSSTGIKGTITLPAGLTALESGAFASCANLHSILISNINQSFSSIDGIIFDKYAYRIISYPAGRTASHYALPSSVRTIAPYAFAGADNITSLTLSSVVELGEASLARLSMLESLYIPASVERIRADAFTYCFNLSTIEFAPNGKMRTFESRAFSNCGLNSITVPYYIESIESAAFCNLKRFYSIYFEDGSRVSVIQPNTFSGCLTLSNVEFGQNSALREIAAHAFDGLSNLSSINLEETNVEIIGDFAFRFTYLNKYIRFPDTLKSIGRYAFYATGFALREMTLPASLEHISSYAFLGIYSDFTLYFESDTLPISLDEDWDRGVRSYSLGVSEIITEGDFMYSVSNDGAITILEYLGSDKHVDLTAIALGGSSNIRTIAGNAFKSSGIESIVLPEGLKTIQSGAFRSCALRSISIPKSVIFIGKEAFASTPIESLSFADNAEIKIIEQSAFENTAALTSVVIPKSVTEIGRYAFRKSGITSLTFEDGIAMTEISEEAFALTKIESVDIPDSVSKICDGAFREIKSLTRVTYGSGELTIGTSAFYMSGLSELYISDNVVLIEEYALTALSSLVSFEVSPENPHYKSVDGVLYTKDGRKLVAFPAGIGGEFKIPDHVEEIGFGAFERSSLESVIFPEGGNILSIGYRAFFSATNLKSIAIPDSVVAIDYYAFAYCSSLESVKFGASSRLRGVYEGAFYACSNLYDIKLPDTVVEISDFAFFACRKLKAIPVGDGSALLGIYSYAFAYTGITEVDLHPTIIDLGAYAFLGTDIRKVEISNEREDELSIGIGLFMDNNNMTEISVPFIGERLGDQTYTWLGYVFGAGSHEANKTYTPDTLKIVNITGSQSFIGENAFRYLNQLEYINLTDKVTSVGRYAFEETTAIYELTAESLGNILNYGQGYTGVIVVPEGEKYIAFTNYPYVTEIVIPDGAIDVYLYGCSSIKSIIIPEGVKEIRSGAFAYCTALESIVIPASLKSIEHDAFFECESLRRIEIPDAVTTIEYRAFAYCYSLESVKLPAGLLSIDQEAFYECRALKSIEIPDSVSYIGERAFTECKSLESVILPNSLSEIKYGTFGDCTSLSEFTIPESVDAIDMAAFFGCTSLKKIINNSNVQIDFHEHYTSCMEWILGCYIDIIVDKDGTERYRDNGDTEIIVTADGFRFEKKDGVYTLVYYQGNEKVVTLPESINGEKYTIYEMRGVENVIFPDSFDSIPEDAFHNCDTLKSVVIPSSVEIIESGAFFGCKKLESVVIPSSVRVIDDGAFRYCESLSAVELNEGLEEIGDSAFGGCAFSSISLPSTVKTVGPWAFSYCDALVEIDFPEGITHIEDYTLAYCSSLVRVGIPESVEYVKRHSFIDCVNLLSIDLPKNLIELSNEAFEGTQTIVSIHPESLNYREIDGVVYRIDDNGMPYQIAFVSKGVESVTIPKGIYVGNYAFDGCINLRSVRFEEGYDQFAIGEGAFRGCTSLVEIELPDSITYMSSEVFRGCTSLERVKLPETLDYMGGAVFYGCTSLKTFEFNVSLDYLPAATFSECTALNNVVVREGIKTIGENAFKGCTSLETVVLPESLEMIGSGAFALSGIITLDIPDNVTEIQYQAFWQTKRLSEVVLPAGLKEISSDLFALSGVEYVVIPEGVEKIGASAFSSCHNLKTPISLKNVTAIERYAFKECYNIPTVEFSDKLTYIGEQAFYYCESIKEIVIPGSVETVCCFAFSCCTSLEIAVLGEGIVVLEYDAFSGCDKIVEVTLPSTLTEIGEFAFRGCERLYIINNNSDLVLDFDTIEYGYVSAYAIKIIEKDGTVRNRTYSNGGTVELIDTSDGYRFIRRGDEYELINYHGNETTITLPLYINGHRYILAKFYGADHVIIPEGFTNVGSFAYDSTTKSVVIPDNAYGFLFAGCRSLESVTIGSGVYQISDICFSGCYNLREIKLGDNITRIDANAFVDTAFYKDPANWSGGALYLGKYLVDVNRDVRYLEIKEGTQNVVMDTLSECHRLEYIKVEVALARRGVLSGLTNLKTLELTGSENYNFSIADWFGSVPTTLESVVLGNGFRMNHSVFYGMSDITIFVEEEAADLGWDENYYNWHKGNVVVYGDKWIRVAFFNNLGECISLTHQSSAQVIRIPYTTDEIDDKYVYTIVGYDTDGDGIVDAIPATSTVDIYAHPVVEARLRKFNVKFVDNLGNTIYEYSVPYGSAIPSPELPSKKGYEFVEWVGYSEDMIITEDTVIESIWSHNGGKHVYGPLVFVEASCTERGISKRVCQICDEYYVVDTISEPLGHSYVKTTVDPTCLSVGYDVYTCSCGDSYKQNYIDPLGHSFSEWRETLTPTCTTYGKVERSCHCGEIEIQFTAKAAHKYDSSVSKEPSCTEDGEMLYACACGDSETERIPKLAHSYNRVYSAEQSLNSMMQTLDQLYYATDTDGTYYLACSGCGHIALNSEVVLLFSASVNASCLHTAGEWATNERDDCGLNEIATITCLECNKVLDARIVKMAEEHKFGSWVAEVAPTCTQDGTLGHYECSECHKRFAEDATTELHDLSIAKLNHSYTHTVTPPTCVDKGYTTHTCTRGDHEYIDSYVDALEHDYKHIVTAPTCTEKGYTTHTCARGDHEYIDSYVDALEHDYKHVVTAPTCTEKGYTTHTCTRGDHEYIDSEVDALDHSYGEWYTVTDPTCEATGTKRQDCVRCDVYKTDDIAELDHSYTDTVTPPTCVDKGYTTHTCIRGDHEYIDSYVDELDHDYNGVVIAPTCTEQGYTEHTCTRCDEKYTDTYVSPGDHTYGDWEISVQPTETENGTKSSSCTACGHTITESIPKLEVSGNPTDTPIITPGADDEGDTSAIAITVIIVIAAAAVIGIGMAVSIFAKKKR